MEWGECLVPSTRAGPELAAEIRRQFGGTVPGWLQRFAWSAWLPRAFAAGNAKPISYADPALCNLIALVVSQDNSCRYCYGAVRSVLRILGHREDFIARPERDFHTLDLSPGARAALDLARRVSRANPLPTRAAVGEVAAAGLAPAAVSEVVFYAAIGTFNNRVATLLAVPIDRGFESLPETPLFRLIRPLVAWKMRGRRLQPTPPPPATPPFAALVAALGDSPSAGMVRRTVDEALASDVLPRRTKVLLFAVIARAVGSAYVEREARMLLVGDGSDASDVERVLEHLASPSLDAREARLVPFARETVRYQAGTIQRRMREVCAGFTPAETVETAGVLVLANAVCRMGMLADPS